MEKDNYLIRTMTSEEVGLAVEWAAREGWNPGKHDAEAFYQTDPDGFLVGVLDGELIASISAIRYGHSFGFIGFYIVKPAHRGNGYGYRLWKEAIKFLSGRNIALDGVFDQQANYAKSGFRFAYSNRRYEGTVEHREVTDPHIQLFDHTLLHDVVEYDQAFFPTERKRFLKAWLFLQGNTTFVYRQNGKLQGYGVIRACEQGYKIGPLFADTVQVANKLLQELCNSQPAGSTVYLDVPECNQPGVQMAESHNMKVVFGTARMYTKTTPDISVDRTFGVTTFELG